MVDWLPARHPKAEGLMLLFDGGALDGETTQRFRLPPEELHKWAFVDPDRLDAYVSEHMARRLGAAVTAVRMGGTRYLEAGEARVPQNMPSDPEVLLMDNA